MIPPYLHLTDMDGCPVTVFLHGIVMIAPGAHGGAYIQLNMGGISTIETYEIVKGRLTRLEEIENTKAIAYCPATGKECNRSDCVGAVCTLMRRYDH